MKIIKRTFTPHVFDIICVEASASFAIFCINFQILHGSSAVINLHNGDNKINIKRNNTFINKVRYRVTLMTKYEQN